MKVPRKNGFFGKAFLLGLALAWTALAIAAVLAGRLVFLDGQVAVRPAGTEQWQKARLHQDLSAGDSVRTGAYSRAAILCQDESQIRLNQHTVLTLKSVAPSPRLRLGEIAPAAQAGEALSNYQVIQGEIWLRNKKEKFLFELQTPTVTATIRGTELNVRVQPDGATSVILLEGGVKLANRYGEVILAAGEEGIVLPGKAPTKQVIVQPADAVQWSLFYPGYFSFRDLPLQALERAGPSSTKAALLSQGVAAYDQGRLAEADNIANQALAQNPQNPQALTLMGWVRLQRRQPEEALGFFQRVSEPGDAALVGTALARYQTGDAAGAYTLMKAADKPILSNPVFKAMTGYFAMLLGRVDEARSLFQAAAASSSPVAQVLARSYLAQMDLVQNRKTEARTQADQALALAPASPLALLTRALVDIAGFQLPAAQRRLEKALDTDPRFLDAALYLGKIYLGGNYFGRARRLADQALQQAPRDARVLSLAGFVDVAFRRFEQARGRFTQSIKESPQLAEAHLGLAICQFRFQEPDKALAQMLTATLLDPRLSAYQSELGKAFYQTRAFDKALATWDYAAKLDPRDPTPHFYKGIALTDLNRPGEAVQSINQSIALNNNRAVFRSRLLLDRDQSTRNYNLARAYSQLGLGEWALSKATTAVKLDPLNASPHLFLARAYKASDQRVVAVDSEDLLYRVLSPANQNTFRYLLENDYTTMFEMPYGRATVQGGIGAWEERKAIHDDFVAAYGGLPGAAAFGRGDYTFDPGFRGKNADRQIWNVEGTFKGEPTVYGNLTGFVRYNNDHFGDILNLNDFFYQNELDSRRNAKQQQYEASYLHNFTPNIRLLTYYRYFRLDDHTFANRLYYLDRPANILERELDFFVFNNPFQNLQVQGQFILGKHTVLAGYDYFTGPAFVFRNWSYYLLAEGLVIPEGTVYFANKPIDRTYSLYLLDYWRVTPWMLVELGVFRDVTRNLRGSSPRTINNNLWSPRLGLNFQIGSKHTVRLGLMRYLDAHQILSPLLVPTEVAGLPWVEDVLPGAEIRQVGASWEAQWDAKTFTALRFAATRASTPQFFSAFPADGAPYRYSAWTTWRRYQTSLFMNRILTNWLGLRVGLIGKRLLTDQSFQSSPFQSDNLPSLTEMNVILNLNFLTPKGWQGGITNRVVYQYIRNSSSDFFDIVGLRFGKELAKKRGLITVEVQNLFNRHFFYRLEPTYYVSTPDFYPARRIIGKIQLWF